MDGLGASVDGLAGQRFGEARVASGDSFTYHDPVDGSESANQGYRVFLEDGSRIVFRLSGTGTSGATLRVYLERIVEDPADQLADSASLLDAVSVASRAIARIEQHTGLAAPTGVI